MSSANPRLGRLLDRRNQIENQIKQIQAKENTQKRKLETRQKILCGVILQSMFADNQVEKEAIISAVNKYLKNDRDRNLIENYLESLSKSDTPPN